MVLWSEYFPFPFQLCLMWYNHCSAPSPQATEIIYYCTTDEQGS
jgi:hypothetical protein